MRDGIEYKGLSLVCSKITDGSHFSPKENVDGIYPMLSVKDMMASGFDYTDCKYINEHDYKMLAANGCKPNVNDVLVAKDGSYLKTAFVLKEDKEQAVLSSIAIITPRLDEIIPEYLAFFFKAPHTKAVVEKHYLTGTAIKRVILKGFKSIKAPVPPLSDQERIVSELDLLQSIIEKKKAQLREYDQLAQSIFYDMFGDPVTNEKGWEVKKLGEVCESDLGKTLNSSKDKGVLHPYLCAVNVLWNKIDLSILKQTKFEESELERYSVKKGDLLVCEGGDIGRAAIWDKEENIQYQNALHRIRFKGNILPRYCLMVLYSLKEKGILDNRYGKGVTIKHLVKSSLLSIPIPLPPLPLQQQYAEKIEAIERQKELIKQSITELETLFNSRMDYWFA